MDGENGLRAKRAPRLVAQERARCSKTIGVLSCTHTVNGAKRTVGIAAWPDSRVI